MQWNDSPGGGGCGGIPLGREQEGRTIECDQVRDSDGRCTGHSADARSPVLLKALLNREGGCGQVVIAMGAWSVLAEEWLGPRSPVR